VGTYFEKRHTKSWLFLSLFLDAFVLESIAQMKPKSRAKKKMKSKIARKQKAKIILIAIVLETLAQKQRLK